MRKVLVPIALALALLSVAAFAQDEGQNEFMPDGGGRANRGDLLRRELGLTPRQMRQIRVINRDARPKMREAQEKYRVARRELDQAIYADVLDEESLRTKVRAVAEAQAEVTRLRAMSEVAVRRVLSPEQLDRFRELRKRFARRDSGPAARGMDGRGNMRNTGRPRPEQEEVREPPL